MATVTYVNNDYEVLATAMQQLVTMGYFDSVEYDSENDAVVCEDADENAVLTIARNNSSSFKTDVTIVLDGGATKTVTATWGQTAAAVVRYIYICSGGAYISGGTDSASATKSLIIISKSSNDKVGVIVSGGARTSFNAIATDDDSNQADIAFSLAVPTTRNQTELFKVPTSASLNHAPSAFPDVYIEYTTQYSFTNDYSTPPVSAEVDGKNYLWVGYFMIADEEDEGAAT